MPPDVVRIGLRPACLVQAFVDRFELDESHPMPHLDSGVTVPRASTSTVKFGVGNLLRQDLSMKYPKRDNLRKKTAPLPGGARGSENEAGYGPPPGKRTGEGSASILPFLAKSLAIKPQVPVHPEYAEPGVDFPHSMRDPDDDKPQVGRGSGANPGSCPPRGWGAPAVAWPNQALSTGAAWPA